MLLSLNKQQEAEFREICPSILIKFNAFKPHFEGDQSEYSISLNEGMRIL
jgi:hypothetical protein